MAPGDVATEQGKQQQQQQQRLKEKRVARRPEATECEADGTFVFQAQEAWKDFHNSLRQFYEAGELCDVTLKVSGSRGSSTLGNPSWFPIGTNTIRITGCLFVDS